MAHEFNFFHSGTNEDIELVFGPLEPSDGPFTELDMETSTMAHIMHSAGIFPSVKQARNNGWLKPIPCGFNEFVVTKKKIRINVWFPCKGPGCDRKGCFRVPVSG